MKQYQDLVAYVMANGIPKRSTRGHVDTIGVFGYTMDIDVSFDAFPLLTTKEVSWKNIVIENLWFLSGSNRLDFLHKHGVHFWDDWQCEDGTVPSAYGNFWRQWDNGTSHVFQDMLKREKLVPDLADPIPQRETTVDQVKWALEKLAKNLNIRQTCITSWDPRNAHDSSLPPCHAFHVLNVSGKDIGEPRLNIALCQRSCDIALGVPYNIAGYAFLICVYSRILGIEPGRLHHTLVDAHIYTRKPDGSMMEYDHIPNLMKQLKREPLPLPKFVLSDKVQTLVDIEEIIRDATTDEIMELFKLEDYDHGGKLSFKPAV